MVPRGFVQVFDAHELGFLLSGDPEIDVADWKEHTRYLGEFHDKHMVIRWFWEKIESLSQEMRRKFIRFSTGSSRLPIEGFR